MKNYDLSNFLKIANEQINADTTTFEGIERRLIAWFCFTYNTTPNDDRLMNMTLEELLVLFQMHRIKNSPEEVSKELNPKDSFEEWLKKEMGDEYVSDAKMVEEMDEEEEKYQEKIRKKFPDKVKTDFTNFEE